jgi:hypothetical protein
MCELYTRVIQIRLIRLSYMRSFRIRCGIGDLRTFHISAAGVARKRTPEYSP